MGKTSSAGDVVPKKEESGEAGSAAPAATTDGPMGGKEESAGSSTSESAEVDGGQASDTPHEPVSSQAGNAGRRDFDWISLGSMLAAIASALFAWHANSTANRANDISKEANRLSSRTYLSVSPVLFEFKSEHEGNPASQSVADRYVVLARGSEGVKAWVALDVTNVGSHEARDVVLSVAFALGHKEIEGKLIDVKKSFQLGDIAPGENIRKNVGITLVVPAVRKEFWADTQVAFARDIVRAHVVAEASYLTVADERLSSGVFSGETRQGGAYLGRIERTIVLPQPLKKTGAQ